MHTNPYLEEAHALNAQFLKESTCISTYVHQTINRCNSITTKHFQNKVGECFFTQKKVMHEIMPPLSEEERSTCVGSHESSETKGL